MNVDNSYKSVEVYKGMKTITNNYENNDPTDLTWIIYVVLAIVIIVVICILAYFLNKRK